MSILLAICYALVIAGHGFSAQPNNWKADWEASVKAAEKEGHLAIYGPRGRDQEMLHGEVFAKGFPDIRVQCTPGRLSQMISRLLAEQRAGVRQVVLLLGGTDVLLGTFKDKGLLQPIRPLLDCPKCSKPAPGSRASCCSPTTKRNISPCTAPCPTTWRASIPT